MQYVIPAVPGLDTTCYVMLGANFLPILLRTSYASMLLGILFARSCLGEAVLCAQDKRQNDTADCRKQDRHGGWLVLLGMPSCILQTC